MPFKLQTTEVYMLQSIIRQGISLRIAWIIRLLNIQWIVTAYYASGVYKPLAVDQLGKTRIFIIQPAAILGIQDKSFIVIQCFRIKRKCRLSVAFHTEEGSLHLFIA